MSERRNRRASEIEAAAYRLLETEGIGGTTMAAVARAAKASNETLYRWYGDRTGLFAALVRRNVETIRDALDDDGANGVMRLSQLGPRLLTMLQGPRAIALNRAAAADLTGTLGAELAKSGRAVVGPRVAEAVAQAQSNGDLGPGSPRDITETYFSLLIGDLQIRRATGALPPLTSEEIEARAGRALDQVTRLYPPRA